MGLKRGKNGCQHGTCSDRDGENAREKRVKKQKERKAQAGSKAASVSMFRNSLCFTGSPNKCDHHH